MGPGRRPDCSLGCWRAEVLRSLLGGWGRNPWAVVQRQSSLTNAPGLSNRCGEASKHGSVKLQPAACAQEAVLCADGSPWPNAKSSSVPHQELAGQARKALLPSPAGHCSRHQPRTHPLTHTHTYTHARTTLASRAILHRNGTRTRVWQWVTGVGGGIRGELCFNAAHYTVTRHTRCPHIFPSCFPHTHLVLSSHTVCVCVCVFRPARPSTRRAQPAHCARPQPLCALCLLRSLHRRSLPSPGPALSNANPCPLWPRPVWPSALSQQQRSSRPPDITSTNHTINTALQLIEAESSPPRCSAPPQAMRGPSHRSTPRDRLN